jgi:hypothetical protein
MVAVPACRVMVVEPVIRPEPMVASRLRMEMPSDCAPTMKEARLA